VLFIVEPVRSPSYSPLRCVLTLLNLYVMNMYILRFEDLMTREALRHAIEFGDISLHNVMMQIWLVKSCSGLLLKVSWPRLAGCMKSVLSIGGNLSV
jgi:hypothetical protein